MEKWENVNVESAFELRQSAFTHIKSNKYISIYSGINCKFSIYFDPYTPVSCATRYLKDRALAIGFLHL